MAKKDYHIQLKGYVGGEDFDRHEVDEVLARMSDEAVDVLIDSTGGNLGTGMSVSAAFRQHGNVSVHFVGMNASAATIASLGAKHISIDAGAMYLVHKCSMEFFQWGSLNADNFETLITDCEKIKADLDKIDINVAKLYAKRCRRKHEEMLELMKAGAWLSAEEALEWGFVDEITDFDDEEAPVLTEALVTAMASEGMPIPDLPMAANESTSQFARLLAVIKSFFKSPTEAIKNTMKKTYQSLCSVIGVEAITLDGVNAVLTDEQLTTIDNHIANLDNMIAEKDALIAELQAKLDNTPAESTTAIVEDSKQLNATLMHDAYSQFCAVGASANQLYNSLP